MNYRATLDRKLIEAKSAHQQAKEAKVKFLEAEDAVDTWDEAQQILQLISQEIQEFAHRKIAAVVSKCLCSVFDEPYTFHIAFERKRGKTEASLKLIRGDLELSDPVNEAGGGVIDVAAFALRLSCLMLKKPSLRRVLITDEPFHFINGAELKERIKQMLLELAEELDLQIILSTNDLEFVCGHVLELEQIAHG